MSGKLASCSVGTRIVLTCNETGHEKTGMQAIITNVFDDHVGFKTVPSGDDIEWYAEPQEFEILNT